MGISDGGIGASSFGRGFTGYSYSDAYVEASSEGFKGTYSDFITISLTQMSRASYNGNVVVHTWYNYNDDEGAVARKTRRSGYGLPFHFKRKSGVSNG